MHAFLHIFVFREWTPSPLFISFYFFDLKEEEKKKEGRGQCGSDPQKQGEIPQLATVLNK